jgi:hypothetical protein
VFCNCFKDKNNKNRIEKQKNQCGMSQIPIRRCNLVHIFLLAFYLIHLTLASLILIENFILFIFESLNLKKEGIYIFLIKNLILMLMSYI